MTASLSRTCALALALCVIARAAAASANPIDAETIEKWARPYLGWHYGPDHVIPAKPNIPGHAAFRNPDVPCVYQLPGRPGTWYMSFIAFDGQGYNSFVAESNDLVRWTKPRLAMGFGPAGEFDHGGCVVGAYLYESYGVKDPRILKKRGGKYWTLYGCYPRQGGYELRPGYEGAACSDDGLTWRRAKDRPILAVQDDDCGDWENSCIYQPWLLEHGEQFYNFYNAANGGTEQMGLATSGDLLTWKRHEGNPILRNRPGSYDAKFCSDGKVFRDGDHWVMFYFGVGKGGAHIMAAFSRDLVHWTARAEPLYKAGGHPAGLDKKYAHKISLVHNPANDTYYMHYCAVGNKGRGIGLLTSKPLPAAGTAEASADAPAGETPARKPAGPGEKDANGFVRIFNGKDLTGWDAKPGWWRVEDGAITAETTKEKPCKKCNYLIWAGGEPGDFELRLKFKLVGGNSGIQFRSERRPDWDTYGYQADMDAPNQWTGCIYAHGRGKVGGIGEKTVIDEAGKKTITSIGEKADLLKGFKTGGWNEYRIIAVGPEIKLMINGALVCHVIDKHKAKAAAKGVIGLQVHPGPPMKVQFKDILLKQQ